MDRDLTLTKYHVLICNGGSCMQQGGEQVTQELRQEIDAQGLQSLVHTSRTRCNGRCGDACVVIVYPKGVWYKGVTPSVGRQIVRSLKRSENYAPAVLAEYNGETFVSGKGAPQ